MKRIWKRYAAPVRQGISGLLVFLAFVLPAKAAPPAQVKPRFKARVAIIIDDIGYLKRPAEELLQVPAHLTFSVLPFTPFGRDFAVAAQQKGFDVMLHLPIPPRPGLRIGPGMIVKGWPESRIMQQVEADIAAVPGLEGVNNHMGTAGPRYREYMTAILKVVKRHKLFYVDSLTGSSVAGQCARELQVPIAKRDVFIDHFRNLADNESSLRQLIQLALKKGSAIGIGHPRKTTAAEIKAMLPEFKKAGVEIVSVAEMVR